MHVPVSSFGMEQKLWLYDLFFADRYGMNVIIPHDERSVCYAWIKENNYDICAFEDSYPPQPPGVWVQLSGLSKEEAIVCALRWSGSRVYRLN